MIPRTIPGRKIDQFSLSGLVQENFFTILLDSSLTEQMNKDRTQMISSRSYLIYDSIIKAKKFLGF
jgi:hypothetical protein